MLLRLPSLLVIVAVDDDGVVGVAVIVVVAVELVPLGRHGGRPRLSAGEGVSSSNVTTAAIQMNDHHDPDGTSNK